MIPVFCIFLHFSQLSFRNQLHIIIFSSSSKIPAFFIFCMFSCFCEYIHYIQIGAKCSKNLHFCAFWGSLVFPYAYIIFTSLQMITAFFNFFRFPLSDVLQLCIIIFPKYQNDTKIPSFLLFSAVTPYLMWEEPTVQLS